MSESNVKSSSMSRDEAVTPSNRAPLIIPSTGPFADFLPADDAPCFCASGKSFADCCGSRAANRAPPYGVFIEEHYLAPDVVADLTNFCRTRAGERLMVIDRTASTADCIVKVEDQRRISERVDVGPRRDAIGELIRKLFWDMAQKHVECALDWYESPELMRYRPGGLYVQHADSQNMDPDTRQWTKVIDRDLSLLVYLNDDYEGGALRFSKFRYRLRPRAGMVVMFPSDSRYVHAAEQVTSGERYVIVSWAAVRGVPKVGKKPPEPALFYAT